MDSKTIIQKYSKLLEQKTYDCIYLETMVEEVGAENQKYVVEIERLKKLLDDNKIDYEDKGDEVSLSPVDEIKETNKVNER